MGALNFQSQKFTIGAGGFAVVNIQGRALAYQQGKTAFLAFVAQTGEQLFLAPGQGHRQDALIQVAMLKGSPGDVVTVGFGDTLPVALGFGLAQASGVYQAGAVLPPQRPLFSSVIDTTFNGTYVAGDIIMSVNMSNAKPALALRRLRLSFLQALNASNFVPPPVLALVRLTGGLTGGLTGAPQQFKFDTDSQAAGGTCVTFTAGARANLPLLTTEMLYCSTMANVSGVQNRPQAGNFLSFDWAASDWDSNLLIHGGAGLSVAQQETFALVLKETPGDSFRMTGYVEWMEYIAGQTN